MRAFTGDQGTLGHINAHESFSVFLPILVIPLIEYFRFLTDFRTVSSVLVMMGETITFMDTVLSVGSQKHFTAFLLLLVE